MLSYLAKRLLQGVPVIIGVTLLAYLLMYLAPGSPVSQQMDPKVSAEDMARWREIFRLDEPFHKRYYHYWQDLFTGKLVSLKDQQPVIRKIAERIWPTVLLNIVAMIIIICIAIPTGVFSATHRYSIRDHTITVLSFLGISIPSFFLAYLLIIFFVKVLHVPVLGLSTFGAVTPGVGGLVADRVWHFFLPALILAVGGIAGISRYMRGSMLEVIRQDYVRTAWAKGLSQDQVWYKHALRNALLPMITFFGLLLPGLLGGSVIIETIFAWPGMGQLGWESLTARDYPVAMTLNLVAAVLVFLGNLIADVLYAVVDPRIRYD